jgi:hypothetical protein
MRLVNVSERQIYTGEEWQLLNGKQPWTAVALTGQKYVFKILFFLEGGGREQNV